MRWLAALCQRICRQPGRACDDGDPSLSASDAEVMARVPGDLDRNVLWIIAGPVSRDPRYVEWEGTRYRFDVATAEAIRLARLLGDNYRPYFTSALSLVAIADTLADKNLTREALVAQLDALVSAGTAIGWEGAGDASSARTNAPTGIPAHRRAAPPRSAQRQWSRRGQVGQAAARTCGRSARAGSDGSRVCGRDGLARSQADFRCRGGEPP